MQHLKYIVKRHHFQKLYSKILLCEIQTRNLHTSQLLYMLQYNQVLKDSYVNTPVEHLE